MKKLFLLLLLAVGFIACEKGAEDDIAQIENVSIESVDAQKLIDDFNVDTTTSRASFLTTSQNLDADGWSAELAARENTFGNSSYTYHYWLSNGPFGNFVMIDFSGQNRGVYFNRAWYDSLDDAKAYLIELLVDNSISLFGPKLTINGTVINTASYQATDLGEYNAFLTYDLGDDYDVTDAGELYKIESGDVIDLSESYEMVVGCRVEDYTFDVSLSVEDGPVLTIHVVNQDSYPIEDATSLTLTVSGTSTDTTEDTTEEDTETSTLIGAVPTDHLSGGQFLFEAGDHLNVVAGDVIEINGVQYTIDRIAVSGTLQVVYVADGAIVPTEDAGADIYLVQ